MAKKINRVLLDCSETYIENLNTGISGVFYFFKHVFDVPADFAGEDRSGFG